jgi:hypothetical protein
MLPLSMAHLTSQKGLHGFAPYDTALVEMHLRYASRLQSIDCFSQHLSQPFLLDVRYGVEIGLEGKHQRPCLRQAV